VIRALFLLGASALSAGCAALPPVPSAGATAASGGVGRVIALTGTVGAMSLMAGGTNGGLQPMNAAGLPSDAAWLSGDGATIVVTTLAGRILIGLASGGGGGSGASPGWIAAKPAPGDLGGNHPLRAFGSLQPVPAAGSAPVSGAAPGIDTRRVAFVEGDPGSGSTGRLVIETLSGAQVRHYVLPRAAESAPAWLADGRMAVVARDQNDRPVALIVDPATGRIAPVGTGALRAIAIGGRIVATIDDDGMVRIGSVAAWLGGQPGQPVATRGPDVTVLQAEPSITGDELALVVADPTGDAASIRILAAAGGWHEIARFGLPRGANRAVVSWLVAR
jgi:hypothetical protein